jgi:hypothetical protein
MSDTTKNRSWPVFAAPVPECHDKAHAYNGLRDRLWPGQLVQVPFRPFPHRSRGHQLYYALILRIYPVKPGDLDSPLIAQLRLVDARRAEDRFKDFGKISYASLNELSPVSDTEDLARYYLALHRDEAIVSFQELIDS